jgi:hypothetical protein
MSLETFMQLVNEKSKWKYFNWNPSRVHVYIFKYMHSTIAGLRNTWLHLQIHIHVWLCFSNHQYTFTQKISGNVYFVHIAIAHITFIYLFSLLLPQYFSIHRAQTCRHSVRQKSLYVTAFGKTFHWFLFIKFLWNVYYHRSWDSEVNMIKTLTWRNLSSAEYL